MRIKSIALEWFRGAAERVTLEAAGRSLVIYGVNGSGKSSFVDAIEYTLNNGKIGHLAHEFSGKQQEKAILNTHKPAGREAAVNIVFDGALELQAQIRDNGAFTCTGTAAAQVATWDYRRTVLRQDEIAKFISTSKGEKYSALLPLLGLEQLEITAENLRQLAKTVPTAAKLYDLNATLRQLAVARKAAFGTADDDTIFELIGALHSKYCPDALATVDPMARCKALETEIDARIRRSSSDQQRYLALQSAAALELGSLVTAVREKGMKLAGAAESLIAERLEVLDSTLAFVGKLEDVSEVSCPACGRAILHKDLQAHVDAERTRLKSSIDLLADRKADISALCDALKSLKSELAKASLKDWRDEISTGALAEALPQLSALSIETIRASCQEAHLHAIETHLVPLIGAAATASKDAPPEVYELSNHKKTVEAAKAIIEGVQQRGMQARAETLIAFLNRLERGVRQQIRTRSQEVINEITSDIQRMWTILHPGLAIENVGLYLSEADKAIDISLKFHGVEQNSPRLTLSEGYRNSLGLCIFLAMAKREGSKDRPLFLDDIVVSLDRDHRGMVQELLEQEFSDRQVIVFTHDREWYTELRHHLDSDRWTFRMLSHYVSPDLGIRWSDGTSDFDKSRARMQERPDSAANDARKIMDIELSLIADKLESRLRHQRGDKNDKRLAHEFLERLIADGKKCFQARDPVTEKYSEHATAIEALEAADALLVTWANRGSHTFDVTPSEASKLIDVCERAIEAFKCSVCNKRVWSLRADNGDSTQCQCGAIRWRYSKA